jgi:hypothetical protein
VTRGPSERTLRLRALWCRVPLWAKALALLAGVSLLSIASILALAIAPSVRIAAWLPGDDGVPGSKHARMRRQFPPDRVSTVLATSDSKPLMTHLP